MLLLAAAGAGLLLDALLTHLLTAFAGFNPFLARLPAIAAALTLAWFIERRPVFRRLLISPEPAGFRYWAVALTASLVNYAVYCTLIYRAPFLQPVMAIVFATVAATAYRLFGHSRLIFRR